MTAPTHLDVLANLRATRDRDERVRWARLLSKEQ